VNPDAKKKLPAWLPLAVGACFVALFASLGAWQISRGLEKRADQQLFEEDTGYSSWHDGMQVRPYQRIRVTGQYDNDRQILIENIVLNARRGVYVITPLIGLDDEPVLLVNRGWTATSIQASVDEAQLSVPGSRMTLRGRVGSLPRAGMKMGAAFTPDSSWPKGAVFPSLEEVAATLGRDVQPFVLLLDADEPHGFERAWAPPGFGPGKHFGYALQWFAMGAVLSGLLAWNYRKKRFK
jgi:surfeit locus 1 family protein